MTDHDPTDEEDNEPTTPFAKWAPSRRSVLYGAAIAGTGTALGGLAVGQQMETIELDGDTAGWIGVSPSDIEGETNPTLQLEAGTEYEVTWENVDGLPHNFVIRDDEEEDLVRTEIIESQGETQTETFTASEEMSTYLCEIHPITMVGDVEIDGGNGTATETETGTPEEATSFFEQGTEVGVRTVAEGMTAPTDFAVADEDEDRFFVTDQTGEVWVGTPDGGIEDEPFIDVSDRMVTLGEFNGEYADPEQEYDERGLLGIAFHPDFAENRRFFLHYSAPRTDDMPENWDHVEVLSEFQATEEMDAGEPDSERRLLEIEHPQYNHDAGNFAFGPDGYLYFPMGDGGGANDSMYGHVDDWYDENEGGNGQDVEENLLGDILRLDVDAQDGDGPYGIPEDNPFAGEDNPGRDEIYAYGLRNPFGMSFDSEGNLFQADAGQNLWEMAYVVERGDNMGWNVLEGSHCFSTENPSQTDAITECPRSEPDEAPYDGSAFKQPIAEYPHTYEGENVGIVVVGGHRYENTDVADLEGKYVFGDWSADPAREEPAGRVFAATPPDDFGDGGGGGAETETPMGDETTATPTETTQGGNGSAGGTEVDPDSVPEDMLWDMEELVFAGSEDGSLGYFVRMFGQDPDGNVYVLGSQEGVPQGDTGVVMQLVPPDEGEDLDGEPTETETEAGAGTETETETETEVQTQAGGTETPTETEVQTQAGG